MSSNFVFLWAQNLNIKTPFIDNPEQKFGVSFRHIGRIKAPSLRLFVLKLNKLFGIVLLVQFWFCFTTWYFISMQGLSIWFALNGKVWIFSFQPRKSFVDKFLESNFETVQYSDFDHNLFHVHYGMWSELE